MNTQNTCNPIGSPNIGKKIFILLLTLAVMVPLLGRASSAEKENLFDDDHCLSIKNRPLSHFLKTQGTLNSPPQFFPDVKDYVGWAGDNGINFALIDYAGLANKFIKQRTGRSLGTKVNGFILECKLPDGRAKVTVTLLTTKALGFAQSIQALVDNNFDFLNTPAIFGAKAQEVVNGIKPSVGAVFLSTTFSISKPGADLPDFLDVVNTTNYAPAKYSFKSTTFGKCSTNNTKARLVVHQEAFTNHLNEWVYTTGKVEVADKKGGSCAP